MEKSTFRAHIDFCGSVPLTDTITYFMVTEKRTKLLTFVVWVAFYNRTLSSHPAKMSHHSHSSFCWHSILALQGEAALKQLILWLNAYFVQVNAIGIFPTYSLKLLLFFPFKNIQNIYSRQKKKCNNYSL